MGNGQPELSRGEIDRVIMMAWEDRASFDAIQDQFGLSPGDVIKLMRREMKPSSFKLWRKRTQGRVTKHEAKFVKTQRGKRIVSLRPDCLPGFFDFAFWGSPLSNP